MSPVLEAHFRLLSKTPAEKIHTHRWQPTTVELGFKRTADERALLIAKLRRLEKLGITRRAMLKLCNCSAKTVVRYLGNKRRHWSRKRKAKK